MATEETKLIEAAAKAVYSRSGSVKPLIGIVLGSGLDAISKAIVEHASVPYSEIPGFPESTAEGHAGKLSVGLWNEVPVAIMRGRFHYYEGYSIRDFVSPIRTLYQMGCRALIVTNAAGCVQRNWKTPSLMLISDHINGLPGNPLVGPNDDEFGPRYPDMTNAYDPKYRNYAGVIAAKRGIKIHEGVYFASVGPSFETPAEVRAIGTLGGDAVGMSSVPEVIVARHCGMRVLGITALTNAAAGLLTDHLLTSEEVLEAGRELVDDISTLIEGVLPSIADSLESE